MKILVCVGMIASGKSTYCRDKAAQGWVVLNDDALVASLHGGLYTEYDKSLKPLYKAIENQVVLSCIALDRNLIIDRGVDVRAESRQRWIALGRACDVPMSAIVFPRQHYTVHARRRIERDNRGLSNTHWYRVAKEHDNDYVLPTHTEGFSEIVYLHTGGAS